MGHFSNQPNLTIVYSLILMAQTLYLPYILMLYRFITLKMDLGQTKQNLCGKLFNLFLMFNRDQEETPARGRMTQLQLGKGLQGVVMCG